MHTAKLMKISLALGLFLSAPSLMAQTSGKKEAELKATDKKMPEAGKGTPIGEATLLAKSGSTVSGTVLFHQTEKGLQVVAQVSGAKPGAHGFHIHEKGDCSAPDALSAGGHYNPTGAAHAGPDQKARHAGDLGNLIVKDDGQGTLSTEIPLVQGLTNWDSIVGKSVILHEKADDLKTQPTGDAGGRIACGLIEAAKSKRAAL